MKKVFVVFLLVAISMPASADDSFWTSIRAKIEKITPKKKISVTTAVGGVRGSQADADDLYWKGEDVREIDSKELEAFKQAVALVDAGKKDDAKEAFEDFLEDYPSSALAPDAETAMLQLK